jgi:hypothetical protein
MIIVKVDVLSSDNRRTFDRRRTYLRGRIFFGPALHLWADCTIQNLADGGAKLKLAALQPLPETFMLVVVSDGVAADCKLLWREGELAGVRFEARHDLRRATDGPLKSLRDAWRSM